MDLDELLRSGPIWRGRSKYEYSQTKGLSTGIQELDRALPSEGWPLGSVIEIIVERYGLGELTLLMPSLVTLTQQAKEGGRGWVLWVAPPFIPYAPALANHGLDLNNMLLVHPQKAAGFSHHDALWAVEHSLRSGSCLAVLAWVKEADDTSLRRLQLAAEESGCLVVLFRPLQSKAQQSPASLRLTLSWGAQGTDIHILKCRGGSAVTLKGVEIPRHRSC